MGRHAQDGAAQAMEEFAVGTLRIGYVGAGFVAHFHARALTEVRGAEVAGITSRTRASAERLAAFVRQQGLGEGQVYDSISDMAPHVDVIDASKIPYGRAMNQDRINELLVEHAKAGRFVVRLKGGDPYVFGRGFEEVLACAEAGVPVTVVPGVTSAFAVPAVADVPVSHRGVAHEIVVVSGHVAPGHPQSLTDWSALARLRGTIVLMMGVERIAAFADALLAGGRPGDTPVAVVQDGTTRIQRTLRTTLAHAADDVRAHEIAPPAVIVIGPVAGLVDGPVSE